ncbi:MAG: dephospho-CoA kinase [Candidatus Acidiferrales bacterium]|jgi:dephospho-CoA kinase
MLRVGLTGGIACGKSTVAAMLREMGFLVLNADPLAHRLMEPGQPAYAEVLQEFGRGVCDAQSRIDRTRLAALVFSDPDALERLNEIIHPRVIELIERQLAEWARVQPGGVAFAEAALIAEADYDTWLDRLVVAWCRPEQQRERLLARGFSLEEAARRIAAQMPVEEKKRLATDLIDCSGTLEETRRQVEVLAERLRALPQNHS